MATAYIGIGTNLGHREANIRNALRAIAALEGTEVIAVSKIYETAPVGPVDQEPFLNAAAALSTMLKPEPLRQAMSQIELDAGRPDVTTRPHWGPRVLDLDLLLYDDQIINTPDLKVPHPRMHERWFVLKPLADVAADVTHPTLDRTVTQLLAAVDGESS